MFDYGRSSGVLAATGVGGVMMVGDVPVDGSLILITTAVALVGAGITLIRLRFRRNAPVGE